MTEENETKNPIQVADRLFQALELLATNGAMGLQELSNNLSLNKSTTHRVVSSLVYMGYVKQEEDSLKYRLSFKILEISQHLIAQINMVEIARPSLKKLADTIQETAHLVQLDGMKAVYIDKVESSHNSIRMTSNIGKSLPLYCSGVGKALLANMSNAQIQMIWEDSTIVSHTEHTIVDFITFMKEIEQIRTLQYALDNEENEVGVRCIAISLNHIGAPSCYALSISAPIHRMGDERILECIPHLLKAKKEILTDFIS